MMQESIHIFISYAHKDESLKNQLLKHLALLQNQGFVTYWHNRDINAGMDWAQAINTHLNTAHLILLLVSADFLASQYCYSIEMNRALERHRSREACVIPVILRPVDWHEAPFSALQALPSGGKPVTRWPGPSGRDTAFADIAKGIRTLVKEFQVPDLPHKRITLEKKTAFDDQKQEKLAQSILLNPIFSFSQPLTRPEEFYGREYECFQLLEGIRKRSCISIVGPFHIGKTWLLQYLMLVAEKELGSQFVIRYMDATLLHPLTRDSFFTQVTELFAARDNLSAEYPETRFPLAFEELTKKGFHAVLCIDEFDAFMLHEQFDPEFFSFLRAQATRGWLTLVTASRRWLYEIAHPKITTSPFFNIFRVMQIDFFEAKDAEQLILAKGTQAGLTVQEQRWLLTCTQMEKDQWHPLYLQLAGTILLEDKNFAAKKDPSYYRPDDPTYWQDFEHRLKKQIFMIEGKTYESSSTEKSGLTIKDVKDALDQLENQSFLQVCKLSEMYYVLLHDKGDNGLSTGKSLLVRELLQTAFKNMRLESIRSDSAIEWRLYNILYYRYLKYHLPIEKLMKRLSITSPRQFYREQERAFQALLEEILKLEGASYLQWLSDK